MNISTKNHEKSVAHFPLSFLAVFQRVSATPSPSPRFARCPRRRKQSAGLFSSAGLACSLLVRIPLKKNKDHEKFVAHLPLSFLAVFQRVSATPSPSPRFARCPRRRNQSAGLVSSAGLACSLLVRIPLKKIKTTNFSWSLFLAAE